MFKTSHGIAVIGAGIAGIATGTNIYPRIFIHGHLGWTLYPGTGKALAQMIPG